MKICICIAERKKKKERKPEAWSSPIYTVRCQRQSFRPRGSQKGGDRSIRRAHPFSLPENLKKEEEVNRLRRPRPSAETPCLSPPLGLQREGVREVSVTLGTLGGSHCICRPIRTQGTVTEKELCMVSMSEA